MSFLPNVCLKVVIISNRKNEKHVLENETFILIENILCMKVMLLGGENGAGWPRNNEKKNGFVH